MNWNILLAVGAGILIWCALMLIVLALMRARQHTIEDDEEQSRAVSRPAALRPHVRAGSAYGEPL